MIHVTFKKTKSILALSCILLITSMLQSAPFVYVANLGTPPYLPYTVSVIDAATNEVIKTIDFGNNSFTFTDLDGGPAPFQIANNGKTVYISCIDLDTLTATVQLIDVASNELLSPIVLGANTRALSLATSPDENYVYLIYYYTNSGSFFLGKINTATNILESSIPIPGGVYMAIAPNGLTAYLIHTDSIEVVDLANETFAGTIYAGYDGAIFPVVSPDSAYLYISRINDPKEILQYDLSNRLIPNFIQSISYAPLGTEFRPLGLAITADGKTLYFTNIMADNYLVASFDISNPLTPVPGGYTADMYSIDTPIFLALTPDQQSLYATDRGSNHTSVYNITSPLNPTLRSSISVGVAPGPITIASSSSAPTNVSGCKTKNVFLLQTDYINKLTWSAPVSGSPAAYNIYRDAALTQLAGSSTSLEFYDHGRNPNEIYTYYITAVDSSGNQSSAASVTVTSSC